MTDCILQDFRRGRRVEFSVNGPKPSFRLRTERIAAAAVRDLEDEVLDLLDVAAAVFYSDSEISRGGDIGSDMASDWHRHLNLTIPVRRPQIWRQPDVLQALTSAVDFLTGDHFEFEFIKADYPAGIAGFLNLDPSEGAFRAEQVIMFSGGLDSFAGALETLATAPGNVILVSHQSAPKVAARQNELAEYLEKRFRGHIRHIMVPAHRAGTESRDTTQRSRSLLFAAMGSAIARTFGATTVSFFENGIVSHNLPVSPQIVGTMASRTTHPQSLFRLQMLMDLVLQDAPRIRNPYEWMTKTEVIERISRHSGERMISTAVSCTKVRDQTVLKTHCGSCSQCLDRRFAILNSRLDDADPSSRYETDVLLGARDKTSAVLPVEWTKHHLQIGQLDETEFLARFGTEIGRIVAAYPVDSGQEIFGRVVELHRRQAKIVLQVLKAQVEQNAEALAGKSLPTNSLLVMHLGPSNLMPAVPLPTTPVTLAHLDPDEEDDVVPSHSEPLTLVFEENGADKVVRVLGLCRFTKMVATVTFELKKHHEADRLKQLPPDQFSFNHLAHAESLAISKEQVRVLISRGRKSLAKAYEQVLGEKPDDNLLFQTKQSKGYRLNPHTRIRPNPSGR